jgi:hypothetical protein
MKHLDGQVLSLSIVNSHASVNAASNEEVSVRGVGDLGDWFVELSKFISYTCLIDIKYSHHS